MKPPCKNCENRALGCHSTCEAYLKYDACMKQMRKERAQNVMIDEMVSERIQERENRRKRSYMRALDRKRSEWKWLSSQSQENQ